MMQNKAIILFLFCWMLLSCFWWQNHIKSLNSSCPSQKNIFILAGQSNMAGRGGAAKSFWDGNIPFECRENQAILRLNAQLSWEIAHEPLHIDIDVNKTCGVGPGMAFANAVLDRNLGLGAVGLVPCAVGGTSISEWSRGSVFYNELVKRARVAVEGGGIIRAILWFQGERDTIRLEDAKLYKHKMERLILDLRSDLESPMLPLLQVALASGQGPFLETVREAQLRIELPNVITVDAKGLPLEPDGLHLSTRAQVHVGEMLADAFLNQAFE